MVLQLLLATFVFWFSTSGCGGTEFGMVSDGGSLPVGELATPPTAPSPGWCRMAPSRTVIATDAEWQDTWAQLVACRMPAPPAARVDFAREMVVLVSVGERTTGGYSVSIDSAAVDPDGVLRIRATEFRPGPQCFVTTAITYPAAVARIPRTSAPVTFDVAVVTKDCG